MALRTEIVVVFCLSNMKYFSMVSVFQYSWDQVSCAIWQRYPNPFSSHVLSEDVVERSIKDGCLKTKRIISKTNKLPKLGERLVAGMKTACVVEESVVNPRDKTFTTYTRNIGLTRIMVVVEKCIYRPSPENKSWTICEKQAWIESNMYGLSRVIQSFGLERFKKNAVKASRGLEYVLTKAHNPDSLKDHPLLLGKLSKEKLKEKAQQKAAETLSKKSAITN